MKRNWLVTGLLLVMAVLVAFPCVAQDVVVGERNPFVPVGSLVGSLQGGPTIGVALSWKLCEVWDLDVMLDLGGKRAEGGSDWFAGFSTDACALLEKLPVLKVMAPIAGKAFPAGTCIGWEYLFDASEPFFVLRTPLTSF